LLLLISEIRKKKYVLLQRPKSYPLRVYSTEEPEKEVRRYNFLTTGVHNGFNYAPCAVLVATEDGKDFEIMQAVWGYVPGFVKTRTEANIFRAKFTTLNFKSENLFVKEEGKRSMWADAAKTVVVLCYLQDLSNLVIFPGLAKRDKN